MSSGVLRMPRLSDSMREATNVAWLKHASSPRCSGRNTTRSVVLSILWIIVLDALITWVIYKMNL